MVAATGKVEDQLKQGEVENGSVHSRLLANDILACTVTNQETEKS